MWWRELVGPGMWQGVILTRDMTGMAMVKDKTVAGGTVARER